MFVLDYEYIQEYLFYSVVLSKQKRVNMFTL